MMNVNDYLIYMFGYFPHLTLAVCYATKLELYIVQKMCEVHVTFCFVFRLLYQFIDVTMASWIPRLRRRFITQKIPAISSD